MPEGTKKVKDITISKMFTILNLLTFDRAKSRYMENGDLCSGAVEKIDGGERVEI